MSTCPPGPTICGEYNLWNIDGGIYIAGLLVSGLLVTVCDQRLVDGIRAQICLNTYPQKKQLLNGIAAVEEMLLLTIC